MKQFIKFIFSSCLGTLIALGIIVLGFVTFAQFSKKDVEIKSNSVLKIDISNKIPDYTGNIEPGRFSFNEKKEWGLQDLKYAINKAKTDDKIKGIYLNMPSPMLGTSSIASLRDALEGFKESGKFIYSYADYYGQKGYYLSSVSDSVFLNRSGFVDFRGFSAVMMFFKDFIDDMGLDVNVFYAGQFKSATEPLRRNDMSEQSKLQLREYLTTIFNNILIDISSDRNLSLAQLNTIADEFKSQSSEGSINSGLVDVIAFESDIFDLIKTKLNVKKDKKINFISIGQYRSTLKSKTNFKSKDRIAVIYAEGEISGSPEDKLGAITEKKYVNLIEKIAKDDKIKAIVLRVNSPGGSGLVSDKILNSIKRLKATGKKVVVSMGDYAASGGYYIACEGDKIFAEANTLTGSIGVFSVLLNFNRIANGKFNIHFDSVRTHKLAGGFSSVLKWTPEENTFMQGFTDRFYERFLTVVSEGRNLSRDSVHVIAQGRVWTGKKAMELGLVDEIGGLEEALESAKELAELDDYRLVEYPKIKDPLVQMIEKLTGQTSATEMLIKSELGELYPFYSHIKNINKVNEPLARLPFNLTIK